MSQVIGDGAKVKNVKNKTCTANPDLAASLSEFPAVLLDMRMFTSTCWYPASSASSELPNERWTKAVETPRKVQPRVNHILGHGSIMEILSLANKTWNSKRKIHTTPTMGFYMFL